jgi:DNA-binding PadR family transcriptional regulator
MHKRLLLLGLLQNGALHGYELARIVTAHGDLYEDLKKANIYYLLDRLAHDGLVTARAEAGARGRRGERLIYTITRKGRAQFRKLLGAVLSSFELSHTGVDVAVVFLAQTDKTTAMELLESRRQNVTERRELLISELATVKPASLLNQLAVDHLLALVDTELAWLEQATTTLDQADEWPPPPRGSRE